MFGSHAQVRHTNYFGKQETIRSNVLADTNTQMILVCQLMYVVNGVSRRPSTRESSIASCDPEWADFRVPTGPGRKVLAIGLITKYGENRKGRPSMPSDGELP